MNTGLIKEQPTTNNLLSWSAQGILLLNKSLTVEYGQSGSHKTLWQDYSDQLIRLISQMFATGQKQLTFVLWGAEAQKVKQIIHSSHRILEFYHPEAHGRDWASEHTCFTELAKLYPDINWMPDINIIRAYTDGSTNPNRSCPEAKSGYAVVFSHGPPEVYRKYWLGNVKPEKYYNTNIRAEGAALILAMEKVVSIKPADRPLLHIVMDCDFWINATYDWIPKWKASGGFAGKKNDDIITRIDQLYQYLYQSGTQIAITHIPSHGKKGWNKDPSQWRREAFEYNKQVDLAATRARLEVAEGSVIEVKPLN